MPSKRRARLRLGGGDVAIDLGTANTLVYVRGAGIVLSEPSVIAINTDTGALHAVGEEARRMIGRTPATISATRPLRHGVIADFEVTEQMLRYFIKKVQRSRFAHPRVVMCVPSGVTDVEQRAVEEACLSAGAREVQLVEEPIAAAIGAGLPIGEPNGSMVVDIGGGTSEVAVMSLGGIVVSESLRIGGYELDEAITAYLRREHRMAVGQETAEGIKVNVGSAVPSAEDGQMELRARDLVSGGPKNIILTGEEVRGALEEPLSAIIEAVKETLERTPPELALATSGPGATNLVTAIADAIMDSVPTVFLTGQVRTELIGTDGFQEADVTGITLPIVKHSILIQDPREIPRAIHEAFHIARSGRPGPVLVDIPQDLSRADIPYEPLELDKISLPGYQPTTEGNAKQIRLAAKALANARRPVIYGGGGIVNANAAKEFAELCTSDRFPVTLTVMGLGAFPAPHDQWLGMLGMHGTRAANYAMDEADLIVAVGARFDDRITGKLSEFAPRAKFVHIDIDPAEISKNVPAHIPIVGDAKNVVPKLTAEYRALDTDSSRLDAWWERIHGWQEKHPLQYEDSKDSEIKPQRMIEAIYEATGGDAIVTSDVGQHQMWCAQYFHFKEPRRWINSGGLGTMGFGLPSAMGAKVARPDEDVVCLAGDGSLIMTVQELATCATEDIPVKVFIMNNGYYGMVRQWQELFWDRRYKAVEMSASPDWVKLADAFGCLGVRVADKAEVVDVFKTALAEDGPVVVDVHVTKEENCYPMIPAGKPARDMVG